MDIAWFQTKAQDVALFGTIFVFVHNMLCLFCMGWRTYMNGKIRKRDGREVAFDAQKIVAALGGAFLETEGDPCEELARELVLANHSKVMYDYDLIPKDQIRQPV